MTPRAGVVFLPRPSTSIKVLYGQAFRAPNPYELFYGATTQARMGIELEPERVQSAEIVWEQYFSSRVRS